MLNKTILMGRVVRDLELKETSGGKKYLSFCLACPRDLNKDVTDFIDCVAWGQKAEVIAQYVNKGHRLIVSGPVQTRTYEEGDAKRKITEVLVSEVFFVESKKKEEEPKKETPEPELPFDFTMDI